MQPIQERRVAPLHTLIEGDEGQGAKSNAMHQKHNRDWSRDVPNSLNFSQEPVVFLLGHSLRSLYHDVVDADLPEHLKALVRQLDRTDPQ